MPVRNPNNNPTDRILKLLAEIDDMQLAYTELYNRARGMGMPLEDLIPMPPMVAFHVEMQRQGNNYRRVRPEIVRARNRMRQMRDMDILTNEAGEPRVRERERWEVPRKRAQHNDLKPDNSTDINERVSQAKFEEDKAKLAKLGIDYVAPGNAYKPPATKDLFSKTKPTEEE